MMKNILIAVAIATAVLATVGMSSAKSVKGHVDRHLQQIEEASNY